MKRTLLTAIALLLSSPSALANGDEFVLFIHVAEPEGQLSELQLDETLDVKLRVEDETGEAPLGGRIFWYSNIDGLLGESTLDSSGRAELDVAFRSDGSHVLLLQAVDAEGRSAKHVIQAEVGTSPLPVATVSTPRNGSVARAVDGLVSFSVDIEVREGTSVSGIWSSATEGPLATGGAEGSSFGPLVEDTVIDFTSPLERGPQLLVLRLWTNSGQICTYFQEIEVE